MREILHADYKAEIDFHTIQVKYKNDVCEMVCDVGGRRWMIGCVSCVCCEKTYDNHYHETTSPNIHGNMEGNAEPDNTAKQLFKRQTYTGVVKPVVYNNGAR